MFGNGTQWEFDDKFAMAPNINKPYDQGWEWVYNNLPGSDLVEAKCAKPGDNDTKVYSANTEEQGHNHTLEGNHTYDVYWSGSENDVAIFSDQQPQQQQQQSSQPQNP